MGCNFSTLSSPGPSQPRHVGPLTPDDLSSYTAKQDKSHLRLGLRKEGMLLFLEQIGFAQWTGEGEKTVTGDWRKIMKGWNYKPDYTRDPGLATWLDAQVGEVKVGNASASFPNGGLKNVTGYDLADYTRKWQRSKGLEHLSVCEIILVEPDFQHLRQYVGLANVFWSHIQMESFLGMSSTYHDKNDRNEDSTLWQLLSVHNKFGNRLPDQDSLFLWVDYFCLKQCQSDFNVDCVIELINDIGTLVAALDSKFEYLKRSFCVLELYGAVRGSSNLLVNCPINATDMRKIIASDRAEATGIHGRYWVGPVDLAAAQTRDKKDKNMIDGFLQQLPGGFDAVNSLVTEKILEE